MRLTRKENGKYVYPLSFDICLKKLEQFENIEEEIGIELIVLFKAIKNGIFINNKYYDVKMQERPYKIDEIQWGEVAN